MLVAAVAVTLAAAGCGDGQVQRSDTAETGYVAGDGVVSVVAPDERDPAPEFSAPLLDGSGDFTLAEAAGEVVVLNVWGSWCAPCRKEAPGLQALHEELGADGVRFVGVNTKDTEGGAAAFEDEFGITYPSVFDPKGDALLAFRDTLPPAAIPSTLVIDRAGRMAARVLGPISEASLGDLITDVLAEDAAAT
jgi:thiol-disulfide isomerase/thioredoxin